jgi:hypothetical protein
MSKVFKHKWRRAIPPMPTVYTVSATGRIEDKNGIRYFVCFEGNPDVVLNSIFLHITKRKLFIVVQAFGEFGFFLEYIKTKYVRFPRLMVCDKMLCVGESYEEGNSVPKAFEAKRNRGRE